MRRGSRRDAPRVLGLLGGGGNERACRRLLGGLQTDVYLAEDARGTVVGLVSVAYARSLVQGGLVALLDGVRAPDDRAPVVAGLVAFAEERARTRGCRHLAARVAPEEATLRAALLARGYAAGELFSTELGATA